MIESFLFPLPPSLNSIISTARNNRYASGASKKKWTEDCFSLALGKRKFPSRVWMEVYINYKRMIDPDNGFACLKPALDGLVRAGVLVDDSPKIIQPPIIYWWRKVPKSDEPYLKILISDSPMFNGRNVELYQINYLSEGVFVGSF